MSEDKSNKIKADPASNLMRVTGMGRMLAERFVAACNEAEKKSLGDVKTVHEALPAFEKWHADLSKPDAGMQTGKNSTPVSEAEGGQDQSDSP